MLYRPPSPGSLRSPPSPPRERGNSQNYAGQGLAVECSPRRFLKHFLALGAESDTNSHLLPFRRFCIYHLGDGMGGSTGSPPEWRSSTGCKVSLVRKRSNAQPSFLKPRTVRSEQRL